MSWLITQCNESVCTPRERSFAVYAAQDDTERKRAGQGLDWRARITRFVIQISAISAIAHGARNATATPIIRKLHMIAPALCARVRRSVASKPLSFETMFPWL